MNPHKKMSCWIWGTPKMKSINFSRKVFLIDISEFGRNC